MSQEMERTQPRNALVIATAFVILSGCTPPKESVGGSRASNTQSPGPSPVEYSPIPSHTQASPPFSPAAWGGPSDYKFGRLPGGDYPNSCAFSRTDASGPKTIDKARIEYWACRDDGGDPENGFRVTWADGKKTTYTFQNNGTGTVTVAQGSTRAMTWRNNTHRGEAIIVITHQDGTVAWIPGHVD